jgi:hypothetical protein
MEPLAARGRDRLGPQHSSGRLLGGMKWRRMPAGNDLEGLAVNRGTIGILPLNEDETDSGRRHR